MMILMCTGMSFTVMKQYDNKSFDQMLYMTTSWMSIQWMRMKFG